MSMSIRTNESEDDLRQKVASLIARREDSNAILKQQDSEISEVKKQNVDLQKKLDSLEHMLTTRLDSMMHRQQAIEAKEVALSKEDANLGITDSELKISDFEKENPEYFVILAQNTKFSEDLEKLKKLNQLEASKLDFIEQEDKVRQEQIQKEIERKTLILQQREKEIEALKQYLSYSNSNNHSIKSKNQLVVLKDLNGLRMRTSSKNSGFSGGANSWLESDEESVQSSVREHPHISDHTKSERVSRNNYSVKESNQPGKDSPINECPEDSNEKDPAFQSHADQKNLTIMNTKPVSREESSSPVKTSSSKAKPRRIPAENKMEYYKNDPIAEDKREHAGDYNERYNTIKYYDDYHSKYKTNVRRKFENLEDEYFVKKGEEVLQSEIPEIIQKPDPERPQKRRRRNRRNNYYDCDPGSTSDHHKIDKTPNETSNKLQSEDDVPREDSYRDRGRGGRYFENARGSNGRGRGRGRGSRGGNMKNEN